MADDEKDKTTDKSQQKDTRDTSVDTVRERDLLGKSNIDDRQVTSTVTDLARQTATRFDEKLKSDDPKLGLTIPSAEQLLGRVGTDQSQPVVSDPAVVAGFSSLLRSHLSVARHGGDRSALVGAPADTPGTKEKTEAERLADLTKANDAEGLKRFALETKDKDLAARAVRNLYNADPQPENLTEMLREIGKSDTHAAWPALSMLCLHDEDQKNADLVADRFKNGDLVRMLRDGKADGTSAMEAMNWAGLTNELDKLFKELHDRPDLRKELAKAITAQEDFGGLIGSGSKGVTFTLGASDETRQKAIEELIAQKDPRGVALLEDLSRDNLRANKDLAVYARKRLGEVWTETQRPEAGQSAVSDLLTGPKLKEFVDRLNQIRWNDTPKSSEMFTAWQADSALITQKKDTLIDKISLGTQSPPDEDFYVKLLDNWHDDKKMTELLKHDPEFLDQYRLLRKEEQKVDAQKEAIDKVLQAREEAIKPHVERICKELGIPTVEVNFSHDLVERRRGQYRTGHGIVELRDNLGLQGDRPSPQLLATLMHEIGHAEQDALMIRRLGDELKIGPNATPEERTKLREEFVRRTEGKTAPTDAEDLRARADRFDDKWTERVLKEGGGKPLTAEQAARADGLFKAHTEKAENTERRQELLDKARQAKKQIEYIERDIPTLVLLGPEADKRVDKMKRALNLDELPPRLKAAYDKYTDAEKAGNKDAVRDAEQTLRTEYRRALSRRAGQLGDEAHELYKDRGHEVETHEISRRSLFFASATTGGALEAAHTNDVVRDIVRVGGPTTAEGRAVLALLDPAGKLTYAQKRAELEQSLGGKAQADAAISTTIQLVLDRKMSVPDARAFSRFMNEDGHAVELIARDHITPQALNRIAEQWERAKPTAQQMMNDGYASKPGERGGMANQRKIFLHILDNVLKPGGDLYKEGWRLLPAADTSAADKSKADFILLNVKDGRWLPWDVKQAGRTPKTEFASNYPISVTVDGKEHKFWDKQNAAGVEAWLTDYVRAHEHQALNICDVRPPDIGHKRDPNDGNRARQEHHSELSDYRTKLQEEANRGSRQAADRLQVIDELLRCNELCIPHYVAEGKMQDHAVDALRRFIEGNVDHFKKSGRAATTAPTDVPPGASAEAQELLTRKGNGIEYRQPQPGDDPATFRLGELPKLVDQAIDKLNISDADKALLRKNLVNATDRNLLQQFEAVLRNGMAERGDLCPELAGAVERERSSERRAQAAKTGESIPGPRTIEEALRTIDETLNKKSVSIDRHGVTFGKDKSVAELWRSYATAGDPEAKQKALHNLNSALDRVRSDCGGAIDVLVSSKEGPNSLQSLLKSYSDLKKALRENTHVQLDATGRVQPGDPVITYKPAGGTQFTPDQIKVISPDGKTVTLKDGTKISTANIEVHVTVAGSTDPTTLGRELVLAQARAAHELSVTGRTRATTEKPGGFSIEERARVDRQTQDELRTNLAEVGRRSYPTERAALQNRVLDHWNALTENKPFPTDLTKITAEDKAALQMCISDAAAELGTKDGLTPEQVQRVQHIAERWNHQLDHPQSEPGFDHINAIGETPGGTAGGDLYFRPSTSLSEAESAAIQAELAKYGANPLADSAVTERFARALSEVTRNWTDLTPEYQRQKELASKVQSADALMKASAVAEARQRLGTDATADAVQAFARKLITGEQAATASGAFETTRKHYAEARDAHAQVSARIEQITKARALEMQTAANKFCKENGIPEVRINVVESLNGARASYEPGTGVLNIPRAELLDRPGGIRATNAMYHEIVHAQQDALIISNLADQLGIKHAQTNKESYKALADAYKEATGRDLTRFDTAEDAVGRKFVDQVLKQRKPEGAAAPIALTETQRAKATEMAKAFKEAEPFAAKDKALAESQRVAAAAREWLNAPPSTNPSQELFRRLATPDGQKLAEHLFGSSDPQKWPEDVRRLFESWKAEPKDNSGLAAQWDEGAARDTVRARLEERVEAINTERAQNHERYMASLAEKEAHLLGAGIERATRAEYLAAVHASGATRDGAAVEGADAAQIRRQAREAGLLLSDQRNVVDLVDNLSRNVANWRDDLSQAWERGAQQRTGMQEALERAQSLTGQKGYEAAQAEYLRAKAEYYSQHGAVHDALAQRQTGLQAQLDKYCADHGLPKVKLQVADVSSSTAGYNRGTGTVTINPQQLLNRSGAQQLFTELGKQMLHAEQDARVIAAVVQRANAAKPPTAEDIARIKADYEKATGSKLTDSFLETVRVSQTQALSEQQLAHADRVAESFKATRESAIKHESLMRDRRAIADEMVRLGQNASERPATQLLERLSQPGSEALWQHLFGVKNANELPADHPARKLMEQYKAAAVGGLRPGDGPKWSEKDAMAILRNTLSSRDEAVKVSAEAEAAKYNDAVHAKEANTIASDIRAEAETRQAELQRLRRDDGKGLDMQDAEKRLVERRNEQKYLDLLSAKVEELFPGQNKANLPADKVKLAMDALNRDLKMALTGFEKYGVKLTADEARNVASSGDTLTADFARAETAPDARTAEVAARVRTQIAPEGARPASGLPYDPWPPARDLASLAEGRLITESSDTGVRMRRESGGQEWTGDKLPSEEDVKKYVEQRLKEMREELAAKEKAGHPVTAEERVLLESLEKTHEMLKTDPKAYDSLRPALRNGFGRTRAAAGSAVAVGIIVSAAIGYYIKLKYGDRPPSSMPALDLPKT